MQKCQVCACYPYIYYTCKEENAGYPEHIRLKGVSKDKDTDDTLYNKTEWSQSDWKAAAQWTGSSNGYWDTINLDF